MINQKRFDVYCFRLYDFWSESCYREDEFWFAHKTYRPFLVRYQKDFDYKWKETAQHCGRFPANIMFLPNTISDLRLKHFGWAKKEDRIRKYNRYRELDPDSKLGWKEHRITSYNVCYTKLLRHTVPSILALNQDQALYIYCIF